MRLLLLSAATAVLATIGTAAQAGEGQTIFDQNCAVCHNRIAPKIGDKGAWAPRIKKGTDALVTSALKGKGMMKPQGGKLTPAQVRAAVEYIVERSK